MYLEAPVKRVTMADVVMPLFAREQVYLPSVSDISQAIMETLYF